MRWTHGSLIWLVRRRKAVHSHPAIPLFAGPRTNYAWLRTDFFPLSVSPLSRASPTLMPASVITGSQQNQCLCSEAVRVTILRLIDSNWWFQSEPGRRKCRWRGNKMITVFDRRRCEGAESVLREYLRGDMTIYRFYLTVRVSMITPHPFL